MEYKRQKSGRDFVHHINGDHNLRFMQRVIQMGETKIAAFILNAIGVPLSVLAFIVNLDNVKSAVLFIVALTFILFRIYFFVIWAKQKTRKNELEIRRMEKELNN